jgi:hypothetical protein
LSTIYGKKNFAKSAKETVRELGLAGQNEKRVRQPWRLNYYIRSGACCVVCKVAKYLRSFDRNYFVDGDNRFYR